MRTNRVIIGIVTAVSLGIFTVMRALGSDVPYEAPSYLIDSATPVGPPQGLTDVTALVEILVRILREILAGLPVG